jgi:Zn-dependent protease
VSGRFIQVAHVAGIPMRVSAWWLAVLALLVWSLGAGYFPNRAPAIDPLLSYGLALASALLLCLSVIAHECGHAFAARSRGIGVESIDLWLLGGMARLQGHPRKPRDEVSYAAAGPAVSAVLAAAWGVLAVSFSGSQSEALRAFIAYQLLLNAALLAFNTVPALPLDGGRVLRAAIWEGGASFDRATEIAARAGRWIGLIVALVGVAMLPLGDASGVWLTVIGVFLVVSATAEGAHARLHAASSRVQTATMMSAPAIAIPSALTVQQAAESFFLPYHYTAFPVVDTAGAPLGILTISRAEAVPASERTVTAVGDVAERDPELRAAADLDVAQLLERPVFARVGRAAVVDRQGSLIGLISVSDVQRSVRALRLARGAGQTRAKRLFSRRHPRMRTTT